ncbi:MAG: Thiamine pyrophosphokinase [Anaerolineales bacterium]|nr:Thiamine pyrophosphokinase [Anaerolineales bacterium]
MPRCLIFANGTLPNLDSARRLIHADDFILCADGGTRHALTLGLTPRLIIGDLDSATLDLESLTSKDAQVIQFPRDKNETDLELALEYAVAQNYREIVILAALGNRLDQTLGNIALLSDPRYSEFDIRIDDGIEQAFFCRAESDITGMPGDLISILPWGGAVTGVRTAGLKWTLNAETLLPHKTRGISNEMLGEVAQVKITSGLLLIIHRRK